MKIIYFGSLAQGSTSLHRFKALERIGHCLIGFDTAKIVYPYTNNPFSSKFHFATGYKFLQSKITHLIEDNYDKFQDVDLIWIDSGELFGPNVIRVLKGFNIPLVLYNIDDPTGGRDVGRFKSLLKAIPLFDLIVVVRQETESECKRLGAKNVLRVFRSYDEVAHHPIPSFNEEREKYETDVVFVGTWMRFENRDKFLLKLIEAGIKVSIWGGRWEKSRYFNKLASYYKGGNLSGDDYVAAIQFSKVSLGFLSKGNRDLHTTRSLEIPYIGGLLCAERTEEHLILYEDGIEAIFWSDPEECIEKIKVLLSNPSLIHEIKIAGNRKVMNLKLGNEDICGKILQHAITLGLMKLS